MIAAIPTDHLYAEIAAAPFAGEAAFLAAATRLDPKLADGDTATLWRALERDLAQRAGGRRLDALVALRDRAWFGLPAPAQAPVGLDRVLTQLAADFLNRRGAVAAPRDRVDDVSTANAMTRLRWLTFALPEDLLCAALDANRSDCLDPPHRVDAALPVLHRALLDGGLAETHLHLGAGFDFPAYWASAMFTLATNTTLREDALASPGAVLDEGRALGRWLLAGAIVRLLLAGHAARARMHRRFEDWVREDLALLDRFERRDLEHVCYALLAPASSALTLPPWPRLQHLYQRITGFNAATRRRPETLADLQSACDPMADFYPTARRITPEAWFVRSMLRSQREPIVDALFWQVVRVRGLLYQHIVQRPMVSGLQWFTRFYGRLGPLRTGLDGVLVEAAAERTVEGHLDGLASLEVRTSPSKKPEDLRQTMFEALSSWRVHLERRQSTAPRSPEFGIVLHFIKRRDHSERGGPRASGRPSAFARGTAGRPENGGLRFESWVEDARQQADTLRAFVRLEPELLWFVRGLDVANDEVGIPTWAVRTVLEPLRRDLDAITAPLGPSAPPAIRVTAHCGEDFVHLLGGLRQVHEAVELLAHRNGDRLGHAVALGTDAAEWARRVGPVWMSRETRLWDLVWEFEVRSRQALPPFGRREVVERGIRDILLECDLRGTGVDDLLNLSRDLQRLRDEPARWPSPSNPLLDRYLSDSGLFDVLQSPVLVRPDAEVPALDALANWLRDEVARRGRVVETNPSSNLLIADLHSLQAHPVLRLAPIGSVPGAPHRLSIALGSDDPITFSTSLLREYELMFGAQIERHPCGKDVEDWLEGIRRTSLAARFTVRPPATTLNRLIDRLAPGRL